MAEQLDLDELQALYDATTPGQWESSYKKYNAGWYSAGIRAGETWVVSVNGAFGSTRLVDSDAEFITSIHNMLPALLTELTDCRRRAEQTPDLATFRAMARSPQHYSSVEMAGALHTVLDRLGELEQREQNAITYGDGGNLAMVPPERLVVLEQAERENVQMRDAIVEAWTILKTGPYSQKAFDAVAVLEALAAELYEQRLPERARPDGKEQSNATTH